MIAEMNRPAVLCCAISGALADRDQCPAIPYAPAEYAAEARRIVDEGGVHIHIHARTPDGKPSQEIDDYLAIKAAIVGEIGDAAIINFSTGTVGVSVEKRIAYLEAGLPEVASMNYAKYSERRKAFVFEMVFANPLDEIAELLAAMRRLGIKPEHECFDIGHVATLAPFLDMDALEAPLHADFVMGVVGGIPATAQNLAAMAANLPPGEHHWGVIGIGRVQWQMVTAAIALGGSVRVGLEDNFYLPDGEMASSNGDLVATARRLVEGSGRALATVAEARQMLGVPVRPQ
jgi:uncharacterized protein (DUF849 family)